MHCFPLYTGFVNSADEAFHVACLLAPSSSFSTHRRRPLYNCRRFESLKRHKYILNFPRTLSDN